MTTKMKTVLGVGSVGRWLLCWRHRGLVGSGRALADDPVMHHVKYTVTAQNPIYAAIYYLDHEPPYSLTTATTPTVHTARRRRHRAGQTLELRAEPSRNPRCTRWSWRAPAPNPARRGFTVIWR